MSINSIETAVKYSDELDRVFTQKSATGFFADNNLSAKFVGAKTVMIPNISFDGLSDYDRESGFNKGSINVSNSTYTMKMDRARSLQIDREDMDETGIANLAGKVMGEYVRTKVVPECDAYVISKLAQIADEKGNYYLPEDDLSVDCLEVLLDLISDVQNEVGFDEELVAFIQSDVYNRMQKTTDINKMLVASDFKQGEINLNVKSLNGVSLIPIVGDRMRTEFIFGENGYKPSFNSCMVYMMVCPKKCAHLVKKTEKMRIFSPEQNVEADAYKFDYRIYYDLFVPKSHLSSIRFWKGPECIIYDGYEKEITVTKGSTHNIQVSCTVNARSSYQWYTCDNIMGEGAKKIPSATMWEYKLPTTLEVGTYYYLLEVRGGIAEKRYSDVITVTVVPEE